jgi:hypothetical protein
MTVLLDTVGAGQGQLPNPTPSELDALLAPTAPTAPPESVPARAPATVSRGARLRVTATALCRVVLRRRPLTPWVARLTAAVTFTGLVVAGSVAPPADGPDPVLPWWAEAVNMATLVALLASWAALGAGRRTGLWLGALGGAGMTAAVALCPAVDHHVIAGWWWTQLAISMGIAVVTVGLLAFSRPAPRR